MSGPKEITQRLLDWRHGDEAALDYLMPLIYDELHRLANRYMRRERPDHTLQPTALVHEAYLRLVELKDIRWQDRAHFFAIAAQLMRRILVDHARRRRYARRGGGAYRITLDRVAAASEAPDVDLMALDEALTNLASFDPPKSRIVELRYFGGLTIKETAEVLALSPATIKREWQVARAWLYGEIKKM